MAKPSKETIEFYKNQVNNLKNKFEVSFKKQFRNWQLKVFNLFVEQQQLGNTVVFLNQELKNELEVLMINHYHDVAEGFVPGTSFTNIEKFNKKTVYVKETEEEEEDAFFLFLFPEVLLNIENSINDQISLNFPTHFSSIITTTETIGNNASTISEQQNAPYKTVLAPLLIARETTVSITETDWIAEASMNTSLEKTTPVIQIADEKELKELQKISPNTTLKETDIDELFLNDDLIAIDLLRRTLSNPQKIWINLGDGRVRPSHVVIGGTTLAANKPFKLPGGLLMFPADSSLGVSFDEVVNCRCYALYF